MQRRCRLTTGDLFPALHASHAHESNACMPWALRSGQASAPHAILLAMRAHAWLTWQH